MERILRRWKGSSRGAIVLACLGMVAVLAGMPESASAEEESSGDVVASESPITKGTLAIGYKHKEGEYGGVTPGVIFPYADEAFKQRTKRPEPRQKNALYWIGFQPREGGSSRVFVQLGRDVEYEQRVENDVLLVTVVGVRHRAHNTLRRIDTRFFDSAVLEVKAKRVRKRRARKGRPAQKAGIQVAIKFKNPADAREARAAMTREQDGYHYLYLDFGPGTALPKEPESGGSESPGDVEPKPSGE